MSLAVIVLGHSHMSSLIWHLKDRQVDAVSNLRPVHYHMFDTTRHGADFHFSEPSDGGVVLSPVLVQMIEEKVDASAERVYVSMFGGNAHNALTLLELDEPIDFGLPFEPDLPLDPARRLLTFAAVTDYIKYIARHHTLDIAVLSQAVNSPVFHFESPPPIQDDAYISTHLEKYFKDQGERSVAPPLLRYKLWRTHGGIISDVCKVNGVEFLPAPKPGIIDGRWLNPLAYVGDSTHASGYYGGLLLRQLEARLSARYTGWVWL